MNVFNLYQFVMEQYKAFSRYFTKIKSSEISSKFNVLFKTKGPGQNLFSDQSSLLVQRVCPAFCEWRTTRT